MTEKIKISILIPVYNAEKYLRECLDSVIYQSLKEIEAICINDCSTDNSLQILQEYASRDSRIKVFDSRENRGVFCTKKAAVACAAGKYVMFMDDDDSLALDACRIAYEAIERQKTDIVVFGIYLLNQKITIQTNSPHITNPGMAESYFANGGDNSLWRKIFETKLLQRTYSCLENVHFNILDDAPVTVCILALAKSISSVNAILYNYRDGIGTSNPVTEEKMQRFIDDVKLVKQEIERGTAFLSHCPDLQENPDKLPETAHFVINDACHYTALKIIDSPHLSVPEKNNCMLSLFSIFAQKMIAANIITIAGELTNSLIFQKNKHQLDINELQQTRNELQQKNAVIQQMQIELQQTQNYLSLKQDELNLLQRSVSFRLGRMFTWPLRMARNTFRCLRTKGLVYTLKRIPAKIRDLCRRFFNGKNSREAEL